MWIGSGSRTVADGLGPGGGEGVGPLAQESIYGVAPERHEHASRWPGDVSLSVCCVSQGSCSSFLCPACLGPNEQDLSLTWESAGRVEVVGPLGSWDREAQAVMLGGSHSQRPLQQASSSIPELGTSPDQKGRDFPTRRSPRFPSPADSPS